jgi:excisionase family DNA binding protein
MKDRRKFDKDRRKNGLKSYEEASKELRLSVITLKRLVKQNKIPHHPIGKRVFFIIDEVLQATRKG